MAAGDDTNTDRAGQAMARLERAVGRLEALVADKGPQEADAERARLAAELDQARADYARLEAATGHVSERLDDVITRFRSALGEE